MYSGLTTVIDFLLKSFNLILTVDIGRPLGKMIQLTVSNQGKNEFNTRLLTCMESAIFSIATETKLLNSQFLTNSQNELVNSVKFSSI